jgi:hypothetical protein
MASTNLDVAFDAESGDICRCMKDYKYHKIDGLLCGLTVYGVPIQIKLESRCYNLEHHIYNDEQFYERQFHARFFCAPRTSINGNRHIGI